MHRNLRVVLPEVMQGFGKSSYYDGEHSALSYSEARKKMFAYDMTGREVESFDVFSPFASIRTKLPEGSCFLVIRDQAGGMLSSS
ncbi:MAG: hypothetical protein GY751_05920 [Bacteroidetes bacterium]|nr:hypothetical protein [Bacteroidota bacterium]